MLLQGIKFYKSGFLIFFLKRIKLIRRAGSKTRLVIVAVTNVRDVSHPSERVPPKLLKQNMIKPAISTNEVYIILIPVLWIVLITVNFISYL